MQPQSKSVERVQGYRLDWVVVIMFIGSLLDTGTTWFFVSRNQGVELNPVLGPLIRHSVIWIPIYLLCRPLLVPLLPAVCRFGFAVYFGLIGFSMGANNLSGMLCGRYFLMEVFGFWGWNVACLFISVIALFWSIRRHSHNAKEWKQHIVTALRWVGIFVLLELGFFAVAIAAGTVSVRITLTE